MEQNTNVKQMTVRLFILCGLCAALTAAFGRGIAMVYPPPADFICDGVPLKIDAGEKITRWKIPMRLNTATIKVIRAVKGDLPARIQFRYRSRDSGGKLQVITDADPIMAHIAVGKACRFFLKKEPDGTYIGSLDADYDDGFDVVPLDEKGNPQPGGVMQQLAP